jgi:hypothetical protein
MPDASLSLNHHLAELQQVAADLRVEKQINRPAAKRGPGAARLALGRFFLAIAANLLADGRQTRLAIR